MIVTRQPIEETANGKLRRRVESVERVLVLSIRRHYYDEGWSAEGVIARHTEPGIVCIKGDRQYRAKCEDPKKWVRDVIFYRTHRSTFEECAG